MTSTRTLVPTPVDTLLDVEVESQIDTLEAHTGLPPVDAQPAVPVHGIPLNHPGAVGEVTGHPVNTSDGYAIAIPQVRMGILQMRTNKDVSLVS